MLNYLFREYVNDILFLFLFLQAAVRRASAVLRSQKAPKPKKPTAKKE